jgi:hypothetical protein
MLHACILAANAGVLILDTAYDLKNHGFFEMMQLDVGCIADERAAPGWESTSPSRTKALQRVEVVRLAQIDPRRQFAMAGIVFPIITRRDRRRADLQDIATVLGQGAGAGRTAQYAGQIKHANAREWAVT